MTSELITRANRIEIFRTKKGAITFPRFSKDAGVRFVLELAGEKDETHISLGEFCHAFNGVACESARKRTKPQLRNVMKSLLDDGHLAMPQYDGGQLAGMVFVQNIDEDNRDEILRMVDELLEKAHRLKELGAEHLTRLDAIVSQLMPTV